MKKNIIFLLLIILGLSSISSYATEFDDSNLAANSKKETIRIIQNGQFLNTNNYPLEEGKKVLAPLRLVLENSDYILNWNKNGIIDIEKNNSKKVLDTKKTKYSLKTIKGRTYIELDYFKDFSDLSLSYDDANRMIVIKSDTVKSGDVSLYDLGSRKLDTSMGYPINYQLNGALNIPKGENRPLIIFLHGAHTFTKSANNRYDLGFSYLLDSLKDLDYAGISLNVGINYSFEKGEPFESERILTVFNKTIDELKKANDGKDSAFNLDLIDKIDFENIILVGHSRSGQEIFKISDESKSRDDINIKGLLALAPADTYVFDYNSIDLPTSIILPQLDGDVFGMDGNIIFEEYLDNKARKNESQLVYLYGANHNAFNQVISFQDEGDPYANGKKEKISQEAQRTFLTNYLADFSKTIFEDESLHDNIGLKNKKLYKQKVVLNSYIKGKPVFIGGDNIKNINSKKVDIKTSSYSPMFNHNDVSGFYPLPNREAIKLLDVQWQEKNSSLSFDLKDQYKDRQILEFYMAQDSSNPLNKNKDQSFTVTLIDKNGSRDSLIIKDHPSLDYVKGEVIDDSFYSTHTPMAFLELPLDDFKNIDRNNLKELKLEFTENPSGAMMIRHIEFK